MTLIYLLKGYKYHKQEDKAAGKIVWNPRKGIPPVSIDTLIENVKKNTEDLRQDNLKNRRDMRRKKIRNWTIGTFIAVLFGGSVLMLDGKGNFSDRISQTYSSISSGVSNIFWDDEISAKYLFSFNKLDPESLKFTGSPSLNEITHDSLRGLAVYEDKIYAANLFDNKINIYDIEGNLISKFGKHGEGNGEFNWPTDIIINNERIYIIDGQNRRVQVFDIDLNYILEFGSYGKGRGEFHLPSDIQVYDGKIYVVDSWNQRIQIFDLEGNYLSQFGKKGFGKGEFMDPRAIAFYKDKMYIVDSDDHNVKIFDLEGNYLSQFGREGKKDGEFMFPIDIAIYHKKLFVADDLNGNIQVFDLEGNFITKIGDQAQYNSPIGESEEILLNRPHHIAFEGNKLYVSEGRGVQVLKIDE